MLNCVPLGKYQILFTFARLPEGLGNLACKRILNCPGGEIGRRTTLRW